VADVGDAMMTTSIKRKRREGGSSIVEVALLAPWIFFLFVGIFDFGFYSYAAICTQSAARAVALTQAQTASSTVPKCDAALGEMRMLPNIGYNPASSKCTVVSGAPSVNQTTPVNVCVGTLTKTSGTVCGITAVCADCTLAADPAAASVFATVTYQTIPFVPIPGMLTGQLTISRGAEVRQTTP
jgi:Flp pilus assembly protein TadG